MQSSANIATVRAVDRLVLGSFSPSVLLDVARTTGALAAHGLLVEEEPVRSSPGQFADLAVGRLDVAFTNPDNVLAYRFDARNPLGRTLDARIVAGVDRGLGLGLYAAPGLGPADLPGAVVGVDVPTSGFALVLFALAGTLGASPGSYDVVAVGSTPKRLAALLAGSCQFTMLGAGNELVAEETGCTLVASVTAASTPYLGTVLAVVGADRLAPARALRAALAATAREVVDGDLDDLAQATAQRRLGLSAGLAARHVARLRDRTHGLVPDGTADRASLANAVDLRMAHGPSPADPALGDALAPGSGLLDESAGRP